MAPCWRSTKQRKPLGGYTEEEATKLTVKDFLPTFNLEAATSPSSLNSPVTSKPASIEAVDKSGNRFSCEVTAKRVTKDTESTAAKYVVYVKDLSRLDVTEQMLQRSELVFTLNPLALVCVDLYGVIRHFNRAAQSEFLFTKEEVVGKKRSNPDARGHREAPRRILGSVQKESAVHNDWPLDASLCEEERRRAVSLRDHCERDHRRWGQKPQ